mmetsp:Transcript_110860/g.313731  ORF Transcript_110860/g.313731 Transcript_110860/m.313731 type:complete len:82 (+) Transcript_110860:3007-3252(+)
MLLEEWTVMRLGWRLGSRLPVPDSSRNEFIESMLAVKAIGLPAILGEVGTTCPCCQVEDRDLRFGMSSGLRDIRFVVLSLR